MTDPSPKRDEDNLLDNSKLNFNNLIDQAFNEISKSNNEQKNLLKWSIKNINLQQKIMYFP